MNRSLVRLALAALLAACAADADSDDVIDPGSDPADDVAPSLLASVPEHDAADVDEYASVVLTFSEPMDALTVESHLDVDALGAVSLSWNDDLDTLTITPNDPLTVETGAWDRPFPPAAYRVVVGADASDLAGNPLGAEAIVAFTVQRELQQIVRPVHALTRTVTPSNTAYREDQPLVVGDTADNDGHRAALTFDLSAHPDASAELVGAVLRTTQLSGDIQGDPYFDLGELTLDHVAFGDLDTEAGVNAAFTSSQSSMQSYPRPLTSNNDPALAVDVLHALDHDLEQGVTRSRFLLYFDGFTDLEGDVDRTVISRDDLHIELTYRAP